MIHAKCIVVILKGVMVGIDLKEELEKIRQEKKSSKKQQEKKESSFSTWKGIISRTPSYFSTIGDIEVQNVPKRLWVKLSKEFDFFNDAIENANRAYENDFVWTKYAVNWKQAKTIAYRESQKNDRLIFFASGNDMIQGKAQIIDNNKKNNLILMIRSEKYNKETKEDEETIKFIGEGFDKRFDGQQKEILDKSYWIYTVIDEGNEYIMLCEKKIESSEIHIFSGMKVKINNSNELSKDFRCKGLKELFFCANYEPLIKAMPKEELIEYTGKFLLENHLNNDIFHNLFFDLPFTHYDGNIYRQPQDYMLLRHAQLLSGKVDGYPLSMLSLGVPGCSKTIELECLDHIFQEGIMEAGNSTPKALVPSFKEKPASPGFIMSKNRVALIDEIMKMVDKQIDSGNGSITTMKNQISELNMILEHKRRNIGSGNDNTFVGQSTSKTLMVGNPSSRYSYLHDHVKILDESTLSRLFIWIKDNEHKNFIRSNKILKSQDTYGTYIPMNLEKSMLVGKVYGDFIYHYYLSIYDSCQRFICDISDDKVKELFNEVEALCNYKLQNVWGARGLHHTKLLIDGITKFRCIFKDLDNSFTSKEEDYDIAEKILIKMVGSWEKDMSPSKP